MWEDTNIVNHFNPRSPHGERRQKTSASRRDESISIHAPRTGSDLAEQGIVPAAGVFQSTLPARGATVFVLVECCPAQTHFNPRSPHGERLPLLPKLAKKYLFQSTLPARGATICQHQIPIQRAISIHAPRTGSDIVISICPFSSCISIHAPRTGSDKMLRLTKKSAVFQSTLPARGATTAVSNISFPPPFQSTLPARGATSPFF